MSDNYESYKRVADEYFALYKAFREAGFDYEQAFEMVKAHCTSLNIQNMLENDRRIKTRDQRVNMMRRYMNERVKTVDIDDFATITCCSCGRSNKEYTDLKFRVAPHSHERPGGYICDDCYNGGEKDD